MKTVADLLNKSTKLKRSQAHLDRLRYIAGKDPVIANRVWHCCDYNRFREWLESGEQRILQANCCKKACLCPLCAARRAGKQHKAYAPKIEKLLAENGELKPVMITLTIKAGPDLGTQFDHLQDSHGKITMAVRRGKTNAAKGNAPRQYSKIQGQLRTIEAKRSAGDPNNWHVHSHALALISDWIDVEQLSMEWLQYTGDSYIVDVRAIKPKEDDPDSEPLHAALCEVLKYPLKFAELSDGDAWHFHQTLTGRRLTDATGVLRGVKVGSLEEDEIESELTGPYRDYVARWMSSSQSYAIEAVEDMPLPTKPKSLPT